MKDLDGIAAVSREDFEHYNCVAPDATLDARARRRMPIARVALPGRGDSDVRLLGARGLGVARGSIVRVRSARASSPASSRTSRATRTSRANKLQPIVDVVDDPPLPDDVLDLARSSPRTTRSRSASRLRSRCRRSRATSRRRARCASRSSSRRAARGARNALRVRRPRARCSRDSSLRGRGLRATCARAMLTPHGRRSCAMALARLSVARRCAPMPRAPR